MPQLDVPPPPKGMDRALVSKLNAKYSLTIEGKVRQWIKELIGEDIEPGAHNVERALKNGRVLMRLAIEIYSRIENKPVECSKVKLNVNESNSHFKQMENIELFLKAASALGVEEPSLFPTSDLFEGKNMAMVIATIYQLGTMCQKHNMKGPECGEKPTERHIVSFTPEQLRASEGIIGLQAGTNKFCSQKGMKIGATRHISDYKTGVDMCKEGQGTIGLQAGTNKFASQKGMKMGAVRHIADIRADDIDKGSHGDIGLQAGTNKFASQKGMKMGAVRHIADIRADDMSKESQSDIGLQAGTNKFASQKGMSMGAVRHVADIRADDMSSDGQGIIGLQSGTNKFASQKGMKIGALRHVSDIHIEDMSKDSHSDVGLQAGTNKFASQKGMSSMGAQRHIADIRAEDLTREGSATIGLQMGSNRGASQSGMSFGSQRHVADLTIQPLSSDSAPYGAPKQAAGVNKGMAPAGISYASGQGRIIDEPAQPGMMQQQPQYNNMNNVNDYNEGYEEEGVDM